MILKHVAGSKRLIASLMLVVLYIETIIPSYALGTPVVVRRAATPSLTPLMPYDVKKASTPIASKAVSPFSKMAATATAKAFIGGPTQPESQGFSSVNSDNMVDLFSGDFNYTIPLMDVGGYPLALGYNSGVGMNDDASWVGLGWNLNPGSITRNMRGLPDDFNGTDTITKIANVKANTTLGVNVGASTEVIGFPSGATLSLGVSVGLQYNNYKGLGMNLGINPSINSGRLGMGKLTGALSLTSSSMNGFSIDPSLDYKMFTSTSGGTLEGTVGLGTGYNTRSGLKDLELNVGVSQYKTEAHKNNGVHTSRSLQSFAYPSYLPSPSLPFTNASGTLTVKGGVELFGVNVTGSITGNVAVQSIAEGDRKQSLPAYGYLNYQGAASNTAVLLDFNREKDIPYRETPAVPNIGIPSYTYDVFGISGEGIGGSFRAYRSEVGHVFDHYNRTKSNSGNASADLGSGNLAHAGVDLTYTYSYTETGAWGKNNLMADRTAFSKNSGTYEAAYFRNPGEMTVNNKDYYKNLGGDDVVAVKLTHANNSDPVLLATGTMNKYKNSTLTGEQTINTRTYNKNARDKRTQVVSYLTAAEASIAGFPKYIENYSENAYTADACAAEISDLDAAGGVKGEYYSGNNFGNKLFERTDTVINHLTKAQFSQTGNTLDNLFSVRWTGRIKAPVSGQYSIILKSDDGVRLFINDVKVIDDWNIHDVKLDTVKVNLVEGEFYNIKYEYYQEAGNTIATLEWIYPGQTRVVIPSKYLYRPPSKDTLQTGDVSIEKRVNDFRLKNHISEIDVVNTVGQRYVYGIPVYNLQQKDVTFAVEKDKGNTTTGLVSYTPGVDNTVKNTNGNDHYFSSENTPAYATTFLLTAVLSSDYKDLTGNGVTADDPGNAIKFNYTKIAGVKNPFEWRAPLGENKANYNEGMRTDNRDDKGSYIHGQKELWYLNSIESKTMIAVFKLGSREDMYALDENGKKISRNGRRLKEINLYTKAEFMKKNPKPLKTVHFEYGYELTPGVVDSLPNLGKLTLKKVWFTYNDNQKGERHPYKFHYNAADTAYNTKNVDRWGVFKPARQNPSQMNNSDYPYAVQDSATAANNVAVWALDEITLPSGGKMKVDYESDDYAYVQNKRAAQMFTIAGFSPSIPKVKDDLTNNLYDNNYTYDHRYISINVPKAVSSNKEVYARYLDGMTKIYFRLYVNMPKDKYGNGSEYVSCYATLDTGSYGFFNYGKTIWVKIKGIDNNGAIDTDDSVLSPMAKAALSYLRLNLPSKAYPGSEVGIDVDWVDVLKVLASSASGFISALRSFDNAARAKGWAKAVDLDRSFIRLNNPYFKKYGGGIRVKRITIFDNWNTMTQQKQSTYGQEYIYTTTRDVNGKKDTISSGVATYEPLIGGDENPWRQPLEYKEQVSALAPVSCGYTETPLGEGFFPSPSVGYSKVRVRTINAKNKRSANGYAENCFYTSYDFPTLTDMSTIEKIRFKPDLANLLRINSRHYLAVTQGFKVELNDMHGKKRSEATYAETDPTTAVTSTEYYYKVDNENAEFKHLNNTVMTMKPTGEIDSTSVIGMDMELMADMREQHSVTTSSNLQVNGDMFSFVWPPYIFIPMLLNIYNREETLYQSSAVSKVIYRHGILDKVVANDKGSKVTTRDLLYDSESGAAILNNTENEWGDAVYSYKLPAGWAYDGLSGAYKNIDVVLDSVYIRQGKITAGMPSTAKMSDYFTGGDKLIVYSRPQTGGTDCVPQIATFPTSGIMYAVDANVQRGGTPDIYFVDENGQPFTGNNLSLKVIQSGRKNLSGFVSEITLLKDPRVVKNGVYTVVVDNNSQVVNASATEYKQLWKAKDSKKQGATPACGNVPYAAYSGSTCTRTVYYNYRRVVSARASCPTGYTGISLICYVIPAGKYSSIISQEDADSKAIADGLAENYANATLYGLCYKTVNDTVPSTPSTTSSTITTTATAKSARVAATSVSDASERVTTSSPDSMVVKLSISGVSCAIKIYDLDGVVVYSSASATNVTKVVPKSLAHYIECSATTDAVVKFSDGKSGELPANMQQTIIHVTSGDYSITITTP
ncbi:PA14 domain-containing protein [Chitinophaga sancti]|uniref:PA14 domain-containing protein n=1 Tax=Chitinophaga sancti TaxID=1004 RepID=UPI003F790A5E